MPVDRQAAQRAVHEALSAYLEPGEIAVGWVLTIDVAGPDCRYLAHRAGGGHDGSGCPMTWTAPGMLRSSMQVAERSLADSETSGEDD